jgi:L-aspartate oxidase
MTDGAGVLRGADSMAATAKTLTAAVELTDATPETEAWETTNLHAVATALVAAAARRDETRGCHWREDFNETDDAWRGHLVSTLSPEGRLTTTFEAMR